MIHDFVMRNPYLFIFLIWCAIGLDGLCADERVRFTGSSNLADWLIESIDGAEQNIKVMVFIFEYEPIADALVRAAQRGVNVEVLTDVRSANRESVPVGGCSVPDYLIQSGIACYIYDDRPSIMHHKVVFIDDELYIGSYNFQEKATFTNCENLMQITDDQLVEAFQCEYNRILELSQVHFVSSSEMYFLVRLFNRITPLWTQLRWYLAPTFALSLALNGFFVFFVFNGKVKKEGLWEN